MAQWKHVDRGTVITTTADPGPGWERTDSPPAENEVQEADKAPAKKSTRPRKAAGKTAPKE